MVTLCMLEVPDARMLHQWLRQASQRHENVLLMIQRSWGKSPVGLNFEYVVLSKSDEPKYRLCFLYTMHANNGLKSSKIMLARMHLISGIPFLLCSLHFKWFGFAMIFDYSDEIHSLSL